MIEPIEIPSDLFKKFIDSEANQNIFSKSNNSISEISLLNLIFTSVNSPIIDNFLKSPNHQDRKNVFYRFESNQISGAGLTLQKTLILSDLVRFVLETFNRFAGEDFDSVLLLNFILEEVKNSSTNYFAGSSGREIIYLKTRFFVDTVNKLFVDFDDPSRLDSLSCEKSLFSPKMNKTFRENFIESFNSNYGFINESIYGSFSPDCFRWSLVAIGFYLSLFEPVSNFNVKDFEVFTRITDRFDFSKEEMKDFGLVLFTNTEILSLFGLLLQSELDELNDLSFESLFAIYGYSPFDQKGWIGTPNDDDFQAAY